MDQATNSVCNDASVGTNLEDRLRPAIFRDQNAWFVAFKDRLVAGYPLADQLQVEERYSRLIEQGYFYPTTVLLHHAAVGHSTAGGCLVWPLKDDVGDLYSHTIPALWNQLADGNGVGLDLSALTPRLMINGTGRTSPGVIEVLVALTSAFDGPIRYVGLKRAAFMASLAFDHPDIFEFVTHKLTRALATANLSVGVDDRYLEGLDRDACVPLRWRTSAGDDNYLRKQDLEEAAQLALQRGVAPPDLWIDAEDRVFSNAAFKCVGHLVGNLVMMELRALHELVAVAAHDCGDPGFLNLDAINRQNPTHPSNRDPDAGQDDGLPGIGILSTTAPCGEQPLLPFESCFLGSFNLPKFVHQGSFDFEEFRRVVPTAVCLLDDLIDLAPQLVPEMEQALQACRKIGIGFMGLADVLAELELPYSSQEARLLAAKIMEVLRDAAVGESRRLALTRGPFPNWPHSNHARQGEAARRNATVTTIAPTGHISRLAGCSPSLEPFFSFASELDGKRSSGVLGRKLAEIGFSLSEWVELSQERGQPFSWDGTLVQLASDPTDQRAVNQRISCYRELFKTARESRVDDHLAMLAAVAPYVENGISKTVNLPESASVSDVAALFEKALRSGLKGITVYRNNCRLGNWNP